VTDDGGYQKLADPPIIDPTANVLEHVRSAIQRVDDLRNAEAKRLDDAVAHLKEVVQLQAAHVAEVVAIQGAHQRELASAEQKRLDAISAVGAADINATRERTSATATALQTQITTVADTARQQMQSTATLLQDRIGAVERQQYENRGARVQEVESRDQTNWVIGIIAASVVGVLGLLIGAIGIAVALM